MSKKIKESPARSTAGGKDKTEVNFISLTAHQLKDPLSSMRLSLEMLLDGDFGKISKDEKDIIEKILQKDETLIYLVDDLLDMAKIEEKRHVHNLTLIDIEDLIKSVIILEQEEIINKKIKFKFEKLTKPLKIKSDKEKIFMALQNIFDNAVKYTPIGGKITISLRKNGDNLEIKIEDSGIGIPENQKEKLFSKFFRADNAVKTGTMGSGLGLFIAKSIIETHNGKIWFESKEGEGSTFFVSLPIN